MTQEKSRLNGAGGIVLASALSALLSISGLWLVVLRNVPTRDEVNQMIVGHGPYIEDRLWIKETIQNNTRAWRDATEAINDLRVLIAQQLGPRVPIPEIEIARPRTGDVVE